MNGGQGQARAWLELARVSNAPTVVSNTLAGLAIGAGVNRGAVSPLTSASLCLGGVLLYTGGMALNDVLDVEVDRTERPGRPIPSGRVGRSTALGVAVLLLGLGLAAVMPAGARSVQAGAALVAAIVVYNLLHRRMVGSVLVMGLCRALLYLVGVCASVSAVDHPRLIVPVALLGAYTAAFSLVARREAVEHPRTRTVLAWLPLPLGIAVAAGAALSVPVAAFALIPAPALVLASVWATQGSRGLRPAVLTWIAAFSLIDTAVCAALGRFDLAGVCAACWLATAWSHRRISGT